MSPEAASPLRVLIAGCGVAGLEAMLALRELAGRRVAVTLLAPEREFTYRPMAVATPFARGRMQRHNLADAARAGGATHLLGELASVDPVAHAVTTSDGRQLEYDVLLVAVGAGTEAAFPGVRTWTPELDQDVYGGLLADLEEGYSKQVGYVVPPNVAWPLPAYELALMTAWDARGMGQDDVEVTIYTHEQAPLEIFGTAASAAVKDDLERAGVRIRTGVVVEQDANDPRHLRIQPGGEAVAGRIVALPRAVARRIPGLPADEQGFIPVDAHGAVEGLQDVWAAGDAIAFPIKQGGLAAQQADAAAQSIAARAGISLEPEPFHPVVRGVLLTGRDRQWMRRDLIGQEEGEAERHALWWPPTKIAGRYLAPYLARLAERGTSEAERPAGRLIDFTLEGHAA